MENSIKQTRIEIILLFCLYLIILPRMSMELDMGYWKNWALIIHRQGLGNAYNSSINYFPVYLYGLYFYDLLQGNEVNIIANIYCIKILMICIDFLPIVVLSCFKQRLLNFKIPHLYLLLNIAYIFNSMVWGQIDCIYTNLAFLAIISGLFYPIIGGVFYLLALNTKPQAIEFLPIVLLVLYFGIHSLKTTFLVLATCIGTQVLLLLPFMNSGGIPKLWQHVTHSVDLYNNLSICAFNIWYLIAKGNPFFINDKDTFIIFSYKTFGLVMFAVSLLFVCIPMTKMVIKVKKIKSRPNIRFYETIFLGTGMLCLFFFYLNTQMHERYVHPVVIFFFFYGVVSKNYKPYILISIPYFLSLDKCFSYPGGFLPIYHYKALYASKIIAIWYTVAVTYGSYLYYRLAKTNLIVELP